MGALSKKTVHLVEIVSIIVYILCSILSLLHSRSFAGGVLAGGALAIVNFDLMVRLIAKAIEDPRKIKSGYLVLIAVKFLVLISICFLLLYFRLFHPLSLALGLSQVFIGIVVVGVASAFRDVGLPKYEPDALNETGTDDPIGERHGKDKQSGKSRDFH